jgi:ADP-heptose:LPS heptosyltransferase
MYNVRIPRAQDILHVDRKVHTAEHLASAMFYLGVPEREIPPAQLFTDRRRVSGTYAVIHPFASAPDKTWPATRFREVALHLRESGIEPVIAGAASDDFADFAEFRTEAGAPLAEVKRLLAGASLFIGNDSGPAHMAAAFGVPAVVLFGASDKVIWAPWKARADILAAEPIGDIRVEQVIAAADRMRVAA